MLRQFLSCPPAEAQDVHIVVLDTLTRGEIVVTKSGASTIHLVGRHRCAHTAATQQDAPLHLSARNRACERDGEVRIIIIGVERRVAEIDDFVPLGSQLFSRAALSSQNRRDPQRYHSHLSTLSPGSMPGNLTLRRGYDVVRGESELLQQVF